MYISKMLGRRIKEVPKDASLKSHIYLIRAGYIKQVSAGIYTLMPPALKVVQNIQNIVREEMDKVGGQEVLFPVVMPREMWELSGRYKSVGKELLRFKDRTGHDMVLGMTHEEASVQACLNTATSYDQYPFMIYQIQTKYRDEPRPRGGLIRVREFTMKDAYSFHLSQEDLDSYYKKMYDAYVRIYKRIGLKNFMSVASDTGMMGGAGADEFQLLTPAGEDTIIVCENCQTAKNLEVATAKALDNFSQMEDMKEVFTGNAKTIEQVCNFLNIPASRTAKAVAYYKEGNSENVYLVFLRGDREVNEVKLTNLLGGNVGVCDLENTSLIAGNIGMLNLNAPNVKVIYDKSLMGLENFVMGANKRDYHISGVSMSRDINPEKYDDVSSVQEGDLCPDCGCPLSIKRGIEIGNIFKLGTKYSHTMGLRVQMPDGQMREPIMGCYGIGIGRAMASVAEESSDDKGLVWPMSIAPWHVYLCPLRYDNLNVATIADDLCVELEKAGIMVLFDDRNVSAGVKLSDSELMGMPIRVVVSPKTIEVGEVELTIRKNGETFRLAFEKLVPFVSELIKSELQWQ